MASTIKKDRSLNLDDNTIAQILFGENSENLKRVEDILGVKLSTRGNVLNVKDNGENGNKCELAVMLFEKFYNMIREGYDFSQADLVYGLRVLEADKSADLSTVFADTLLTTYKKHTIAPKSVTQKNYVDLVNKKDLTFAVGPAGTGKTYLAVAAAVKALSTKKVERIVLTRPAVEAGESLGYLPGDLSQKIDPYLRPLYDALQEMLGPEKVLKLIEKEIIEVAPLAYMRGRTLNDSFIILDEAQNTTVEQMKMFLTRLGFGSKVVITGDVTQVDLPISKNSGLIEVQKILHNIDDIGFIYFTDTDVVRHPLVQKIVKAFEDKENSKA